MAFFPFRRRGRQNLKLPSLPSSRRNFINIFKLCKHITRQWCLNTLYVSAFNQSPCVFIKYQNRNQQRIIRSWLTFCNRLLPILRLLILSCKLTVMIIK